ncbi:MAG: hypothetical protein ACOC4G_07175 [Bacillota bacterium]
MKKLLILGLLVAFVMTFSFGVMAAEGTGDDPLADEDGDGWIINEGTLEGWEDSNFETLNGSDTGVSTDVGKGITVDGIKVEWDPDENGDEGKRGPEGDEDFDQEINYTIPAYAEIPCYLEMNLFGNGAYMDATNVGTGNNTEIGNADGHWMLFDTDYGGVVDGNWEFVDSGDFSPEDIVDEDSDRYIQACDLFTANLFANVPYRFEVSSEGLGDDNELPIDMRTYQGGVDINGDEADIDDIGDWSATETLDDDGVEVDDFNALDEAQINMQFRVPFDAVEAGVYEGDVTFSMYSM